MLVPVLLIGALMPAAPARAADPPAEGGRIVGGLNGRCLDSGVNGAKGRNGSIAQLRDCNGKAWQQWVMTGDGRIRSRHDGRCLDADGNGTRDRNGAVVQLWDCNGNAWQKWVVGADHKIRSRHNQRCLDANRNATAARQGALLQLWDCTGAVWQSWPNSLFRLTAGRSLNPGEALVNGDRQVEMQPDGNLVVYGPGHTPEWATGTRVAGSVLQMQTDGNLVMYGPGRVVRWASGTRGANLSVEMRADGNLVILDGNRVAKWASMNSLDRTDIAAVKDVAHRMMLQAGWGEPEWPCLQRLWTRESGWRWNAQKPPSPAYGIPRANPGSRMQAFGSDWRDNPVTQIKWGLSYIRTHRNFRTPCQAEAWQKVHHSY